MRKADVVLYKLSIDVHVDGIIDHECQRRIHDPVAGPKKPEVQSMPDGLPSLSFLVTWFVLFPYPFCTLYGFPRMVKWIAFDWVIIGTFTIRREPSRLATEFRHCVFVSQPICALGTNCEALQERMRQ